MPMKGIWIDNMTGGSGYCTDCYWFIDEGDTGLSWCSKDYDPETCDIYETKQDIEDEKQLRRQEGK